MVIICAVVCHFYARYITIIVIENILSKHISLVILGVYYVHNFNTDWITHLFITWILHQIHNKYMHCMTHSCYIYALLSFWCSYNVQWTSLLQFKKHMYFSFCLLITKRWHFSLMYFIEVIQSRQVMNRLNCMIAYKVCLISMAVQRFLTAHLFSWIQSDTTKLHNLWYCTN